MTSKRLIGIVMAMLLVILVYVVVADYTAEYGWWFPILVVVSGVCGCVYSLVMVWLIEDG